MFADLSETTFAVFICLIISDKGSVKVNNEILVMFEILLRPLFPLAKKFFDRRQIKNNITLKYINSRRNNYIKKATKSC